MECAWIAITFGGKRVWGFWWREMDAVRLDQAAGK